MSTISNISATSKGIANSLINTGTNALSAQQQSAQQLLNQLFANSSGTGGITQTQFEQNLQAANLPPAVQNAANAVFNHLDSNGTGTVTRQAFANGMQDLQQALSAQGGHHHHHHHGGGGGASSQNATSTASALFSPASSASSTSSSSTPTQSFADTLAALQAASAAQL